MHSRSRPAPSHHLHQVSALLLAVLLALFGAAAYAGGNPEPVRITVSALPQADGAVVLSATAADSGGGPVSNRQIEFYLQTEFFGERTVRIGSGVTDTAGTTSIRYVPTTSGQQEFRAVFAGTDGLSAAEGTASAQLTSARPAYHQAPPDLFAFRQGVGRGVLGATLAVWVLLATIMLRVAVVMTRRMPQVQSEPAVSQPGLSTGDD